MKRSDRLVKMLRQNIVLFTTLLVLFLLFAIVNPNFIDRYNVLSMVQSFVPYAILAIGVSFVIATGGVDLSVGASMIAASLLAGRFYQLGMPLFLVIPVMILVGLAVGALNGLLVARWKVPSFIATLGTCMAIRGVSAIIVAIPNVIYPTNTWLNATFSNLNGFPIGIVWLFLFAAGAIIAFHKTVIGRYILSIGSNEEATRLSGINVVRYKFIAYLICGGFAGLAGIFYASSFATIVAAGGSGIELEAIAGAYIGGTASVGGSVSVIGTLLGSFLLVVIRVGLNFLLPKMNLSFNSTYVTYVLTGVIVILSILFDNLKKRKGANIDLTQVPKKKILISGIVSATLVVAMSVGLGVAVSFHGTREKTIAVISKGETHAFWHNVRDGATKAAEEGGYKLTFRGPPEETPANLPIERSLLQSAISSGVDGIALSCICEGFSDLLMQAKEANIPVVQFDSGVWPLDQQALDEAGKNPIVSSVLNDDYGSGKLAASMLFEYVKADIAIEESYTVGVITHDETVSALSRSQGFEDGFLALAEQDPLTKVKSVKVEVQLKPDSTNMNYKNGLDYLDQVGAKAVFMTGEPVITQIYDAVQSGLSQYNDIIFVGYDAGERQIAWMEEHGKPLLLGSIAQDSYRLGYEAVTQVIAAAKGKSISGHVVTPGVWWDKDNYQELIEKKIVYRG